MPRFLRRIVSLVLIPCLLADPLYAVGTPLFHSSAPRAVPQVFSEQALIPVLAGALFMHPLDNDGFLQMFAFMPFALLPKTLKSWPKTWSAIASALLHLTLLSTLLSPNTTPPTQPSLSKEKPARPTTVQLDGKEYSVEYPNISNVPATDSSADQTSPFLFNNPTSIPASQTKPAPLPRQTPRVLRGARSILSHTSQLPTLSISPNGQIVQDISIARVGNSRVYLKTFSSKDQQNAVLSRAAVFIEGRGNYDAYDFRASDLAKFYNQQKSLTEAEAAFRDELLATGLLTRTALGTYVGKEVAVVSVPAGQGDLQKSLISHELVHGIFFTEPAYRAAVERIFNQLSGQARAAFKKWLVERMGYKNALTDQELLLTEFASYVRDWGFFFDQVRMFEKSPLDPYIEALRDASDALVQAEEPFVSKLTGIAAPDRRNDAVLRFMPGAVGVPGSFAAWGELADRQGPGGIFMRSESTEIREGSLKSITAGIKDSTLKPIIEKLKLANEAAGLRENDSVALVFRDNDVRLGGKSRGQPLIGLVQDEKAGVDVYLYYPTYRNRSLQSVQANTPQRIRLVGPKDALERVIQVNRLGKMGEGIWKIPENATDQTPVEVEFVIGKPSAARLNIHQQNGFIKQPLFWVLAAAAVSLFLLPYMLDLFAALLNNSVMGDGGTQGLLEIPKTLSMFAMLPMTRRGFLKLAALAAAAQHSIVNLVAQQKPATGPRISMEIGLEAGPVKNFVDIFIPQFETAVQQAIQKGTLQATQMKALKTFTDQLHQAVRVHLTAQQHVMFSLYRASEGVETAREVVLEFPDLAAWLNAAPSSERDQMTENLLAIAISQGEMLQLFNAKEFHQVAQGGRTQLAKASPALKSAYEFFLKTVAQSGLLLVSTPSDFARFEYMTHAMRSGDVRTEAWVLEHVDAYSALFAPERVADSNYRFMQWAIMVKEGRQAEFFSENLKIHLDAASLAGSLDSAEFDLRNSELRKRALQDPARLEKAKQITAHIAYLESVGYERLLDYFLSIGFTREKMQQMINAENNAKLKEFFEHLAPFLEFMSLKGQDRTSAIRHQIFIREVVTNYPGASILVLAEGLEKGTLALEGSALVQRNERPYAFLLDPRYSGESLPVDNRPTQRQNGFILPRVIWTLGAMGALFLIAPYVGDFISPFFDMSTETGLGGGLMLQAMTLARPGKILPASQEDKELLSTDIWALVRDPEHDSYGEIYTVKRISDKASQSGFQGAHTIDRLISAFPGHMKRIGIERHADGTISHPDVEGFNKRFEQLGIPVRFYRSEGKAPPEEFLARFFQNGKVHVPLASKGPERYHDIFVHAFGLSLLTPDVISSMEAPLVYLQRLQNDPVLLQNLALQERIAQALLERVDLDAIPFYLGEALLAAHHTDERSLNRQPGETVSHTALRLPLDRMTHRNLPIRDALEEIYETLSERARTRQETGRLTSFTKEAQRNMFTRDQLIKHLEKIAQERIYAASPLHTIPDETQVMYQNQLFTKVETVFPLVDGYRTEAYILRAANGELRQIYLLHQDTIRVATQADLEKWGTKPHAAEVLSKGGKITNYILMALSFFGLGAGMVAIYFGFSPGLTAQAGLLFGSVPFLSAVSKRRTQLQSLIARAA